MNRIRVVQVGLGPIGQACVRVLAKRPGIELVGGIDIDPSKVGRDIGEVCGLDRKLGLAVRADLSEALAEWQPSVAVHTTLSFLDRIEDQLASIICAGVHVVSSSEELFYPFERSSAFCERIDALAKDSGVAVVGTGVNPGFVMDLLPLCLTGVCVVVERIAIARYVDASHRRLPLQAKIGAGITRAEFETRLATGHFGHIGLRESAYAIAATLGWPVDDMKERILPVIAERRVETPYLAVQPGQVAGLHQVLRVRSGGDERLVLELKMAVGVSASYDSVEIYGDPPLSMRIEGGIFGDTATIGALINTIPKVLTAESGLRTMIELPVPYAYLS